jgi:hypothetical protein
MKDQALEAEWLKLRNLLKKHFGQKPDMNAVLFIIGMQEFGQLREGFSKEEKQDLMHVGICTIMEPEGYFKAIGKDQDGWPQFENIKSMPEYVDLAAQENFLKSRALNYFKRINYIN